MEASAEEVTNARKWLANEELRHDLRRVLRDGAVKSLDVEPEEIKTAALDVVVEQAPVDQLWTDAATELDACRRVGALRRLIKTSKYSDWETVKLHADELLDKPVAEVVQEETKMIARYIQMQLAASRLRGVLNMRSPEHELTTAIKGVEPFAPHQRQLLHSGQTLVVLRQRMAAGAWADVRAIATQAITQGVDGEDEVRTALREAERRLVEEELLTAIGQGGVRGEPGEVDASSVSVGGMNKAINLALTLGCQTKEAKRLLHSCNVLRQLRNGVLTGMGDLGSAQVRDVLKAQAVGDDALVPQAVREITLVQRHVQDRDAIALLHRGLGSGQIHGAVGEIPTESVGTKELESALAFLGENQAWCQSLAAKALRRVAELMVQVRRALVNEDWAHLAQVLSRVDALRHTVDGPGVVSTQTRVQKASTRALAVVEEEVMCARAEMQNVLALRGLRGALEKGTVRGQPGALNLSVVSTAALDDAILYATKVGVRTGECRRALAAAKSLRRLRHAVLQEDYTTAKVILEEPVLVKSAEVDLIGVHVLNDAVAERIYAAVRTEGTLELGVALDAARQVAATTEDTRWLVHSAEALLRLRSILSRQVTADSWQDFANVIDAARREREVSTSMTPSTDVLGWAHKGVRGELALGLEKLQRESAEVQLVEALGQGQACCMGGFVDASSVKTGSLMKALKLAKGLRLGQLAPSAQAVLSARQGLQAGSWEQVKAALRGRPSGA